MKQGRWDPREALEMIELRDRHKLPWADIAERYDRSVASCHTAYHGRKQNGAAREANNLRRKLWRATTSKTAVEQKQARRSTIAAVAQSFRKKPSPAPRVVEADPVGPQRSSAAISTARLVLDAELRTRIEILGPTGGMLGDPLPGKSALDQPRTKEWCGS